MKTNSWTKIGSAFVALIAVAILLGSSVYGEAPALQIPVIKGTITSIDTEHDCLLIEGSDILGADPLYLQPETCVFMGYEGVNFDEFHRNAKTVSALNRVELSELDIGYEICCTYSYSKDARLLAESIVITKPSTFVPSM